MVMNKERRKYLKEKSRHLRGTVAYAHEDCPGSLKPTSCPVLYHKQLAMHQVIYTSSEVHQVGQARAMLHST
eukprot:1605257-Amphidinium_carterae.2